MPSVFIKNTSYNYEELKPVLFDMMDSIGSNLIKKQSKVLIKPNFLIPARPEKAVITHPLVVKAVVEYVLKNGGQPQVSDSPAAGGFEKILKVGGYSEALKGLDVEFREFKETVFVDIGEPFGKIEIAKDAIESDIIINLPKLKTHTQMLLTLGVKNMFGCIVGLKKSKWHLRTGVDRELFAKLLVKIHNTVNPSVTIVDGILSMEGQGPGKSGFPRNLGILAGGKNAPAIDRVICSILGIAPEKLPTNMAITKSNGNQNSLHINGDINILTDFKFPELGSLAFGPKPLHKLMRKHMLQRPEPNIHQCQFCGKCWDFCPAKAITWKSEKIIFNYDKCIRCYCCIEVCPHGALRAVKTFPGKLMRKIPVIKQFLDT